MSTAQEMDYTTLKWVKNEIDENLKQTRQALESYVENPEDIAQLRFCTTYLHQVYGTLQMVEIYGGALLAEEMEKLAHALIEGSVRQKDDAYDVLMRAILQLPSYLEHLERGEQDRPVILLPLLNDLRASRGEHLLSENAFFSPDLSVSPDGSETGDRKNVPLQAYAKKLRSVFQSALVGLYRGEDTKGCLRKIGAVFKELLVHSDSEASKRLWWVSSAVTEALFEGGLENNNHVKQLISQIDHEIKRLIADGEKALEQNPPTELLKNLLYYVATAKSSGRRVSQIKSAFNLEHLIPNSDDISQAFENLRGSSHELMEGVTDVIKDDLLQIKDQLDVFVRNKDANTDDLKPFAQHLNRISDTLAMLGLGDLHKILADQVTELRQIIEQGRIPEETTFMEIASALLYIESSLESIDPAEFVNKAAKAANTDPTVSDSSLLPPSEQKHLSRLVISEAGAVLARVKESFNTFANDTAQWAVIKDTPILLNQVKGVLSVLNLTKAAQLIQASINYIAEEMIKKQRSPNEAALDELADVITSIEYYLEAITESRSNPDTILGVAMESAQQLGYDEQSLANIRATDLSFLDAEAEKPGSDLSQTMETALTFDETPDPDATEIIALETSIEEEPTQILDAASVNQKSMDLSLDNLSLDLESEDLGVGNATEEIDSVEQDTLLIDAIDNFSAEAEASAPEQAAVPTTVATTVATKQAFKGQPLEDIDEEILEIFIEEADEILVSMHENLNTWRLNPADTEALPLLRRSYHTIKGSGRLAGANVVGEFAWSMENMLNRVIDGKIMTSPSMFVLLEKAEAALVELTKQLKGQACDIPDIDYLAQKANDFTEGKSVSMAEDVQEAAATQEPSAQQQQPSEVIELEESTAQHEPLSLLDEGTQEITQATEQVELEDTTAEVDPETATRDGKLIEIFRKEAGAHIEGARAFIEQFPANTNKLVSEPLMRALHTLHGSARVANAEQISRVSEPLDRYFRTLYDSDLPINAASFDILKKAINYITPLAEQFDGKDQSDIASNPDEILSVIAQLHKRANELAGDMETKLSITGGKARSLGEDAELTGIFIEEAGELIKQLQNSISNWQEHPQDALHIEEIQRHLQTLKSGARMANASSILEFSVELSQALSKFTDDVGKLDSSYPAFFNQAAAWIKTAVDAVGEGGNEDKSSISDELSLLLQKFDNTESESERSASFQISEEEQDPELLKIFLEEAEEILHSFENTIDNWLENPNELRHVNEMQRAMHTLKGAARMASVPSIATVSHAIESVLERVAGGQMQVIDSITQLVQAVYEWLNVAISQVKSDEKILLPPAKLLHEIESLLQHEDGPEVQSIHSLLDENTEQVEMPQIAEEAEELVSLLGEKSADNLEAFSEDIAFPDATEGGTAYESSVAEGFDSGEEITLQSDQVADETQELTQQLSEATEEITPIEIGGFEEEAPSGVSAEPEIVAETLGDADYDQDLLEIFLEEAEEIQHNSEQTLQAWSDDLQNRDHIMQLQRDLHTLKGGARMAGVTVLGDTSHAIETLLEAVTEGRLEPTAQFPQLIMLCHDWIGGALGQVRNFKLLSAPEVLLKQLQNLQQGKDMRDGLEAVQSAAPAAQVESADLIALPTEDEINQQKAAVPVFQSAKRGSDEQIRVRADAIDDLVNFAGEANIYNARIAQQVNAWQFNLTELSQTVHRLHEQLRKFEIEAETQIMYRHSTETVSDDNPDFDPLELDRFSLMQQLSRGMVESLGDLTSIKDMLGSITGEADVLLLQQSRINSDLHESLMGTRLTPFNSVLPRLRRIVRQTCQETGKEANLHVEGAEGEIDRTQLNRIVPALEHILRNAIDHGLETPERRRMANKREDGQIDIIVVREGSEIVIKIRDDGAGINLEALRKKALEKGLINESTRLSKQELLEFILESGFSTASSVTQISGRGVGMDVVNNEIKQLNGSLHIDSTTNQGSEFTIRLPLTVLVNQALLLSLNDNQYALPLSNIEHIVRVTNDELNLMFSRQEHCYKYAGHEYDFLDLSLVLQGVPQTMAAETGRQPLLLTRSGEQRVAIYVEQLLGRQEIVIKSVGPQLASLAHISGATILPNGDVALILDLSSLIRSSHTMAFDSSQVIQAQQDLDEQLTPTVMIVDDSITVRKVTERLLKRHNYDTITAKDGVDALTVMLETIPDVMLLDVEMPRMDGFELATAMRNDERLKNIPIIMITSRTGEKHRDRALSIGVNMYMGKPYQEHDLMKNIETLLGESKDK